MRCGKLVAICERMSATVSVMMAKYGPVTPLKNVKNPRAMPNTAGTTSAAIRAR